MGSGISVSGGAGGTEAHYDDMLATAAQLDHAGAQLDDVVDVLASPLLRWQLESAMTVDPAAVGPLRDTLDLVRWFLGPSATAEELHGTATMLRLAVARYQNSDGGVLSDIGGFFGGIGSFLVAGGDAMWAFGRTRSFGTAANTFLTDDPGLVDELANFTGLGVLAVLDAELAPDGDPVVHDLGAGHWSAADPPPRGVADLMTSLGVRDQGAHGEISVSFVHASGARRRVIVDVTGTKDWSITETDDVTSLVTNTRAIQGESTSYERGVLAAMTRAGVTSADQVMIVGHSQGGMVAVNAARDAVEAGSFDVTHVVTAGSPLGRIAGSLPKRVQLLALEDGNDDIPHLDGRDNPDEPTETTVTGGPDWNDIGDNHSIEQTYVPLAAQVDASDDASVRAFRESADGFFRGTVMTTHAYQITRTYH